jgi:hypothetical protein
MLKGRQTGGMHRGHAWVFRAESYDTMMAWFADIKELTEKSGKERDAFVRRSHARSLSGGSMKAHSIGDSSDGGMEEDEADAQPYSSEQSVRGASTVGMAGRMGADHQHSGDAEAGEGAHGYGDERLDTAGWRTFQRPSPGGRFPSDLNVHRGLQAPLSPSSGESSTERDRDTVAAAGALPGSSMPFTQSEATQHQPSYSGTKSGNEISASRIDNHDHHEKHVAGRTHPQPEQRSTFVQPQQDGRQQQNTQPQQEFNHPNQPYTSPPRSSGQVQQQYTQPEPQTHEPQSQFTLGPDASESQRDYAAQAAAAGLGGAAIGAAAMYQHNPEPQPQHQQHEQPLPERVTEEMDHASAVPAPGTSSAPIVTDAFTTTSPTLTTLTTTDLRPVSSSQGDTISLSTVPTSINSVSGNNGNDSFQQKTKPPSSQQGGTDPASTTEPNYQLPVGVERDASGNASLATKPMPLRTMTAGTISDLHIPGEYPKTPKFAP